VRVLVADGLSPEAVRAMARAGLEVVEQSGLSGDYLAAALRGVSGVIVRGQTKLTRESLAQADALRVACRAGSGVDNIDLEACRERGVAVFNTPGANAVSVAEHTWALILAVHRRIVPAANSMAAGRWEKSSLSGREVRGRALGVIGLGRVGVEVARLGLAFGCRVLGYDPYVQAPAVLGDEAAVTLDTLLEEGDIVSLHVPLTAETRGFFDAARIGRMKRGAVLINCARGGLIDETALEHALASGHLMGAGLDTFEPEPPPARPLYAMPQVVATPHVAASTPEAQARAGTEAAVIVRDFLLEGRASGRVV
jgi:D-3-phosphoglycerate dehydrogenase